MTKPQKIKQLLINHTIQANKHDDCSEICSIRTASPAEIKRAYSRVEALAQARAKAMEAIIGKPDGAMKLIRKVGT